MRHVSNEKRQMTPGGRNGTTKSRQNQKARRKGNLQKLGEYSNLTLSNKWIWKKKIKKEYFRRTRKLLETKQYSRNFIKGINTLAVALIIRFLKWTRPFLKWTRPFLKWTRPFLKWTWEKLKQMDLRTRKLMTMHQALHPRDDVDRLYLSRKEGGGGLASTENCVVASIERLKDYIQKCWERLITATKKYWQHDDQQNDNYKKTKMGIKATLWTF